jgi:hypothetical protein
MEIKMEVYDDDLRKFEAEGAASRKLTGTIPFPDEPALM